MWSIVIGVLSTAIKMSLSIKICFSMYGNKKQKCRKQNMTENCEKLSVIWKGAGKMTILFATFMVSIGIPERDSMVCR